MTKVRSRARKVRPPKAYFVVRQNNRAMERLQPLHPEYDDERPLIARRLSSTTEKGVTNGG